MRHAAITASHALAMAAMARRRFEDGWLVSGRPGGDGTPRLLRGEPRGGGWAAGGAAIGGDKFADSRSFPIQLDPRGDGLAYKAFPTNPRARLFTCSRCS